jgi:hypothetical protein
MVAALRAGASLDTPFPEWAWQEYLKGMPTNVTVKH